MADSWADLGAPAAKGDSWSDLSSAPKQKSEKTSLKEALIDNPVKDYQQRVGEATQALKRDVTEPIELKPNAALKRAAKTGSDVLGYVTSPLSAVQDTVFGRPISQLSGGRISKESGGDIAGLAVPMLGEARAAQMAGKAPILAEEAKAAAVGRGTSSPILRRVLEKTPPSETARNVAALEKAGIKPSLLMATPSRNVRQVGATLGQNVFTAPLIRNAVGRTREGLAENIGKTARKIGTPTTAEKAGAKLQSAVESYSRATPAVRQAIENLSPSVREAMTKGVRSTPSRVEGMGFGTKSELLYDRAERLVKNTNVPIELPNTRAAVNDVVNEFSALAMGDVFRNSNLERLHETLGSLGDRLTWNDAKSLRTKIRERLMSDPQLRGTVSDAQVNKIYRGLTDDLANGASRLGGPQAQRAWEQANKFYATGQDRIEGVLKKVYGSNNPGDIVHDMLRYSTTGRGQNTLMLNQVKRSVPTEVWRDFSASVLDGMGKMLPGKATQEGEFSANTFLTNYNKLKADGGAGFRSLFEHGGRGPDLASVERAAAKANANRDAIENAAHVAGQMREVEKFVNHSQSGAHVGNALGAALIGQGLWTHNPYAAATALSVGNAASYAMQSPKVVRWLAELPANPTSPQNVAKALSSLNKIAGKDPLLKAYYAQMTNAYGQDTQPRQ